MSHENLKCTQFSVVTAQPATNTVKQTGRPEPATVHMNKLMWSLQ